MATENGWHAGTWESAHRGANLPQETTNASEETPAATIGFVVTHDD